MLATLQFGNFSLPFSFLKT